MISNKVTFVYRSFRPLLAVAMVLALFTATDAGAQTSGTINAGTTVMVRTNETINASDSDGQVFSGIVEKNVMNRNGSVAIPRGSDVELVVRETADNQVALDLGAITIDGQRYSVLSDQSVIESERKEGLGANKRTGKYVGGGAVLGAIVGAIAGGGKGAAIGAGAGAAAGAGVQVLTRGERVNVPAESLLTFRLQQPLQTGFQSQTSRFKPTYDNNYNTNSPAYRAGLRAGRSDADRNLAMNTRSTRWTSAQDRRDYEAGYNRGYQGDSENTFSQDSSTYNNATVHIGADNNITWSAPGVVRIYVQADGRPLQLFAEGVSGTQAAPWIEPGHSYVFIMRDLNGNELARDQLDLRRPVRSRRFGR